jgi:hypothetical protein
MKQVTGILMTLSLVILLTGSFAAADKIVIVPVAPACPPQWAGIPNVPGVMYAPNIGQDLFRYRNVFYNFQGGSWFRAPAVTGPWVAVPQPPPVFYTIQAPYFKVPPGWAKGKKNGWEGASMPPGQMKKYDGGYGPPGKGKKFHGWE